ncbi:MAG: ABC-F type ribosomal protection protein [Clostridiales bacterium]|nr:ABC-F type ribosomal protection protein [Clostridiales bacterium]
MSLINVSDLTFSYEGSFDPIFQHVTFQIDTDWKLGFTGRNGRGKTTFLNLLLGKYEYQGSIAASVNFEYFPFPVKDKTIDTADVVCSMSSDIPLWQLRRELSIMDVSEDVLYRPFCTLSNGEQTKVLLAALFLKENSFLLIDEPTNHLDIGARKLVSNYLNRKNGFILVSHDRTFLDSCIDHILSINKTNIEIQKGNFSSWWENKQKKDESETAENEKLKKEIRRLKSAADRTSAWSEQLEKTKYNTKNSGLRPDRGYIGHQSAKMMKRSKTIESRQNSAAEEKSKLLRNIESVENLKLSPLIYHTKRLVLLDKVSITCGSRTLIKEKSFEIEQGNRIAVCGSNGSGKSSLLKLICGEEISYSGTLQRGSNLTLSLVPQDTSQLSGSLSDFIRKHNLDESLFKAILRKLDFSREQFEKNLHEYSEGQKKKVFITKSLCQKAHLYVWDEPLNYMDVFSRMQIENLIFNSRVTLLFVEHDESFLNAVANKIIYI